MKPISTLKVVIALVVVACMGCLLAQAQEEAGDAHLEEKSRGALFKATTLHFLEKRRMDGEYLAVAAALEAAEVGKSSEEIVKVVTEIRRRQQDVLRTRNTGQWGDPQIRDMIVDAAGVLGAATGVPSLEPGARLTIKGILRIYDATQHDKRVYWAHRQHVKHRITAADAKRRILDQYEMVHRDNPAFREANELLFKPILGIDPDSTTEDILSAHPDAAVKKMVQTVLTLVKDEKALVQQVRTELAELRKEQKQRQKKVDAQNGTVQGLLEERRSSLLKAQTDARLAREFDIKITGVESIVYLTATVTGFTDPGVGRAIQTIGDAGIKITKAWNVFEKVTDEFGALKGFASAALTADVVGAVLSVVGLFISGQSVEDAILEGIEDLRNQVDDLHKEMVARFDLVDARLSQVHTTMVQGLDMILRETQLNRKAIAEGVVSLQLELDKQQDMLVDLYPATVGRAQALIEIIRNTALAKCMGRKGPGQEPIDARQFGDCLALFRHHLLLGDLQNQQIPLPKSTSNLASILATDPDITTDAVVRKFCELNPDSLVCATSEVLVGPEGWIWLAVAYNQFLLDWKEYLKAPDSEFAKHMDVHRIRLEQAIEAMSADLAEYGTEEAQTAFGSLIEEVRRALKLVRRAIRVALRNEWREWREQGYDGLEWDRRHTKSQRIGRDEFDRIWQARVNFMGSACSEKNWADVGGRSYLSAVLYPRIAEKHERLERAENRIRNSVKLALPHILQNWLAVGIGQLDVCVLGNITRETTEVEPATDGDISEGAFHKVNYEAVAIFNVRWTARCEDQAVRFEGTGNQRKRSKFSVWVGPPDGRRRARYQLVVDAADPAAGESLRDQLVKDAFDEAYDDMRVSFPGYWDENEYHESACAQTYVEKFLATKNAWLAQHIESDVNVRTAIQAYDETVAEVNAFLRAWIRLALRDAIQKSDLVAALATGNIRLPMWNDAIGTASHETLLEQPQRLEAQIQTVEAVLKSEEVAYMAKEHSGYAGVTDTLYDFLDPDHPAVKGLWDHDKEAAK